MPKKVWKSPWWQDDWNTWRDRYFATERDVNFQTAGNRRELVHTAGELNMSLHVLLYNQTVVNISFSYKHCHPLWNDLEQPAKAGCMHYITMWRLATWRQPMNRDGLHVEAIQFRNSFVRSSCAVVQAVYFERSCRNLEAASLRSNKLIIG